MTPADAPAPADDVWVFPTSFAQQRLWFLDQLDRKSALYNVPMATRIEGELDVPALERSIDAIVRRHEILRTTFRAVDGEPMQVIAPPQPVRLPVVDLRMLATREEREREAARWLREEARTPFDLEAGPLLRATLLRLDDAAHVLMVNAHHIVTDAWSHGIFMRELAALYTAFRAGKPSPLADLPIQYADYAQWQRDTLRGEAIERELAYWKKTLAGAATLELPALRARPAAPAHNGAMLPVELPGPLTAALKKLSAGESVSLFTTMLAAFQLLLFRYTGQEDVSVGSPVANRNRAEIEGLIGFFLNTLVMRTDLSGNPAFRELLGRARATVLGAFAHQELPFETLVETLQPTRTLNQNPLFQAMFVLLGGEENTWSAPGLQLTPITVEEADAKFDLMLNLTETGGRISGWLVYDTDLFDEPMMRRMIGHFQTLLESIAADPDARVEELPMLTDAEKHKLLVEWNQTARPYPGQKGVHEIFEEQAARAPGAAAVVDGKEQITYGELNARANRLARHLQKLGVAPGACVGICMERSIELITGILAILKAGGAYVPLDPDYPRDRLAHMLADTRAAVVLTRRELGKMLPDSGARLVFSDSEDFSHEDAANPGLPSSGEDMAYVMFTSGSTGTPKGAAILHRGISRLVVNADYVQFRADDVVAHVSNTAFDAATFEIWGALLHGARLVILQKESLLSPRGFTQLVREKAITVLFLTTPLFNQMAREVPDGFATLRYLVAGGDALDPRAARAVLGSGRAPEHLVNGYGPTEATTFAVCGDVRHVAEDAVNVPIGRPIANTTAYVLDRAMNPAPIGVAGELYIGGPGVARGYVNRPEITVERFVRDPFSPEKEDARLYKTGDLARWLPDGNVEFLGRIDQQVKIRGFRVELGEIEAALRRHAGVAQCVVIARPDDAGQKRLAAYVVATMESCLTSRDLREWLLGSLPDYMAPTAFVFLPALPLTANGKIDTRALPAPDASALPPRKSFAPAETMLHAALVEIWEELLERRPIGITDDFFELGGHSLLAVRMIAEVEKRLGQKLAPRVLFDRATIAHLAEALEAQGSAEPGSPLIPIQTDGGSGKKRPFFFLHGNFVEGGFYSLKLSRMIGADRPFYAIAPHGVHDAALHTIEAMAASRIELLRTVQPRGPYLLGGFCNGGLVAFEIARQLEAAGEKVACLVMLAVDGTNAHFAPLRSAVECIGRVLRKDERARFRAFLKCRDRVTFAQMLWRHHREEFQRRGPASRRIAWAAKTTARLVQKTSLALLRRVGRRGAEPEPAAAAAAPVAAVAQAEAGEDIRQIHYDAFVGYVPRPYRGNTHSLWPRETPLPDAADPSAGWRKVIPGVTLHSIPGGHFSSILGENLRVAADIIREALDRADA